MESLITFSGSFAGIVIDPPEFSTRAYLEMNAVIEMINASLEVVELHYVKTKVDSKDKLFTLCAPMRAYVVEDGVKEIAKNHRISKDAAARLLRQNVAKLFKEGNLAKEIMKIRGGVKEDA